VAATAEVLGHGVRAPSTLGDLPGGRSPGDMSPSWTGVLDESDPPFIGEAGADPVWGRSHWTWTRRSVRPYGLKSKVPLLRLHQSAWVHPAPWRRFRSEEVVVCACGAATPSPVGGVAASHPGVQPCAPGGATGPMVMRADSGFTLQGDPSLFQSGVSFLGQVKTSKALHQAIAAIKEEEWNTRSRMDRRRFAMWARDDLRPFSPKPPRSVSSCDG